MATASIASASRSASDGPAVMDNPGSCPIQKIPLELLLRITSHLKTTDLCSIRLTCRSIEQGLYTTFTHEFFTRRQFMLTENSLQALIDISKSRFSQYLRCVYFGLDRFPEVAMRPQPDLEKELRFREYYANHFNLWNTGYLSKMLIEAFRNLRSLEDIVIRDFNSRGRKRDGMHVEWTSYGANTILAETGVTLVQGMSGIWNSGLPLQYCSQVFSTITHSLGEAGARPRSIEILSRNNNHLRDFSFQIPRHSEAALAPVLDSLKKLHLCVDLSWRNVSAHSGLNHPRHQPDMFLRRFLSYTRNLEDLRINENHSSNHGLGELFEWLATEVKPEDASAPIPTTMLSPPAIQLPHLRELSLGIINLEAHHILDVVRKFAPSLKILSLHKVRLIRPLDGVDVHSPPKISFWADLLEELKEIPNLDLQDIRFTYLQQQWIRHPIIYHVHFKDGTTGSVLRRQDWRAAIDETIAELDVEWPRDEENFPDGYDSDEVDDDGGAVFTLFDEFEEVNEGLEEALWAELLDLAPQHPYFLG